MQERTISAFDASIFRMHAMLEATLRIQCEILAKLNGQKFEDIMDAALQDVQRDMKELIIMHSNLGAPPESN